MVTQMNSFLTVGSRVLVLFLLISIGFVCNKTKMLNKEVNKKISDIVVIIVTPCVIIQSFQREFRTDLLKLLLLAMFLSAALHIVMIILSRILMHDKNEMRERMFRFAAVFSNAGFMALPLQEALLGADGVFFGAAYVAFFNIFVWSYGIVEISGDKNIITPKKVLLSPGITGVAAGMIIFAFSIKLPYVLSSAISYMAALNVPLPMLVIGYYLGNTDIIEALKDKASYKCLFWRLIGFPCVLLALMYLCGIRGSMLTSMIIAVSAPVAATTTMFSEKFDSDTELSVRLVSVSTLLSMITMPLVIGLTQLIA